MCGIVGVAGPWAVEAERGAATGCLAHRGPDAEGQVEVGTDAGPVWLGHRRLAILDPSPAGAQPMQSRNGRWWVVYNGEIYGHRRLRADLAGPFRGHSDTETLVEALAAWGVDGTLPRLDGMFAFAALDVHEARLHLVRDPFGIKPLYLADGPGGSFAFASEARALRPLADTTLDERALQTFLALRFVPSPATLWRGIRRLAAGHRLELDLRTGRQTVRRWITPTRERFAGSFDEAVETYHDHLAAAVSRQLLSDVPVGILLSGGIDSAVIAALAKDAGQALPCFTVGFEDDPEESEIADAEETARVLGLPHAAVRLGAEDLWDVLPAVVDAVEEPLGTTSILPMWALVRRARQDVTVVLTGQGNDEPWGGYLRYQGEVVRRWMPAPALLRVLQPLGGRLPDFAERAVRSLPISDPARRFVASYALFTASERRALTGEASDGAAAAAVQDWLSWLPPGLADTERIMRVDTRMQLADDLLLYGDKVSMAASLEVRVPMLDLPVVRLVESFPLDFRVRLRRSKIVHRAMARRYLPRRIVDRPKKGFAVPFADLVRGPWRERVAERLETLPLRKPGVAAVLDAHLAGRDRTRQVFALLALAEWWDPR